ncbi:MAG TPA: hypothetical protein VGN98_14160 [Tianweitania sediminis]|jgi:hypothetical protein|nr:hypothetical protein [Tianweitania sediminis]
MDLAELSARATKQEAGHEFELVDPVRGGPTGLKVTLAGPDSAIRKKADQVLADKANIGGKLGSSAYAAREHAVADFFFTICLSWNFKEAGEDLPLTRENFRRILQLGTWIRAQLEIFSNDRAPYFADEDAG